MPGPCAGESVPASAGAAADQLLYRALERGLNFKVSMGNVITLSPPLIITEPEMDQALDILEACLGEIE